MSCTKKDLADIEMEVQRLPSPTEIISEIVGREIRDQPHRELQSTVAE